MQPLPVEYDRQSCSAADRADTHDVYFQLIRYFPEVKIPHYSFR